MKPRDYSRSAPTPDDLRREMIIAATAEPVGRCCAKCKTPGFGCADRACNCHPKETR